VPRRWQHSWNWTVEGKVSTIAHYASDRHDASLADALPRKSEYERVEALARESETRPNEATLVQAPVGLTNGSERGERGRLGGGLYTVPA
jgi:hypothetical protein